MTSKAKFYKTKKSDSKLDVPNFYVWYQKSDNMYRLFNYQTKEYKTSPDLPRKEMNSFYLPSQYQLLKKEITSRNLTIEDYYLMLDKNMAEYADKLVEDRKQLMTFEKVKIKFDYFDNSLKLEEGRPYYRTHATNVRTFMNKLLKDENGKYKYAEYEDVTIEEYIWYTKCDNGGLTYLKQKGKFSNTYGYDFEMSYPRDMAHIGFCMPTKRGIFRTITVLKQAKYITYGIYRVKIECDNANFKKIFKFNKENYYTHYSLRFALQKQQKFNIKVNLIMDGTPHALLYSSLVKGNDLFGNWYYRLKDMKADLKGNSIVKFLSSTAWGHLQELHSEFYNEEQILEMRKEGKVFTDNFYEYKDADYVIKDVKEVGNISRYEVFDTKKEVYQMPFRLLPFITSYGRIKMAKMVEQYDLHDKLIRIQTDGLTLSEEFKEYTNVETLKPDPKISGNIEFHNLNNYDHFDDVNNV